MSKRKSHFFVYTFTSLLQKGMAFLLLPLYTVHLTQKDYGIISISTASIALLSVLFTFGLDSSILRLYFDFKMDPPTLKRKIGSVLTAIEILSVTIGCLFFVVGLIFFRDGFLGIDFYPYYPLILLILIFQPTFSLIQALLQAMEKSRAFMIYNLSYFLINVAVTLYLVVNWGLGAKGVLVSQLGSLVLFFAIGLLLIKKMWVPAFNKEVIKQALHYSIPMIPHSLGGQLTASANRYILGYYFDVKRTGLFHLSYQISQPMELLTSSFNRAFIPYFHNKMSLKSVSYLRQIGIFAILAFSSIAFIGSLFVRDIFRWFIDPKFFEAHKIVHVILFSQVATALYFFFSAILFYDKKLVRLVPICTVSSAIISLGLNVLLVKHWNLWGAAYSQLISQITLFVLAIILTRKQNPVNWNYTVMIGIFITYMIAAELAANFISAINNEIWLWLIRIMLSTISIAICGNYYLKNIPNSLFKKQEQPN